MPAFKELGAGDDINSPWIYGDLNNQDKNAFTLQSCQQACFKIDVCL